MEFLRDFDGYYSDCEEIHKGEICTYTKRDRVDDYDQYPDMCQRLYDIAQRMVQNDSLVYPMGDDCYTRGARDTFREIFLRDYGMIQFDYSFDGRYSFPLKCFEDVFVQAAVEARQLDSLNLGFYYPSVDTTADQSDEELVSQYLKKHFLYMDSVHDIMNDDSFKTPPLLRTMNLTFDTVGNIADFEYDQGTYLCSMMPFEDKEMSGFDLKFAKELERVVMNMYRWKPARFRGKAIVEHRFFALNYMLDSF